MPQNAALFHQASGPGWQLLGELELTLNPDTDQTVNKWLAVILGPLNLHADVVSKVLKSAREVTSRAMLAQAVARSRHLHVLVFAPREPPARRKSWGFFRIEKIDVDVDADQIRPDHTIEFYLYVEGR